MGFAQSAGEVVKEVGNYRKTAYIYGDKALIIEKYRPWDVSLPSNSANLYALLS